MGQFCTSCGTDVAAQAKFCSDCGSELENQPIDDSPESATGETAACDKCETQISLDAMKCPQCGHEPSNNGIGRWILGIIGLPMFLFNTLFLLLIPVVYVMEGGLPLGSTILALFLFGVLAFTGGFILYAIYKAQSWKPTEEHPFDADIGE
ncbi:zinc ribbon domain-containing protein [Salinadaptatus halalkaliphilus]|uniref:Zinc ribbon domain-containing protein n=1 Tax=Salinadaptatus halalkaliphilus TaxID=2419781 RepID=A0A4S3TIX0_9EURY|nr:zinc ribbon domain-containing protein [Salinadaptatus halalkaliphilus]THE63989.1 zinc ribbon domain-containing protein [Salinadaptatus halalkaliphilus]